MKNNTFIKINILIVISVTLIAIILIAALLIKYKNKDNNEQSTTTLKSVHQTTEEQLNYYCEYPTVAETHCIIPFEQKRQGETTTQKKESAAPQTSATSDAPKPYKDPVPAYQLTAAERDMLARLIYLQAGAQSQKCQRAIVSIVFNRLTSGYWDKDKNRDGKITIYDIIYYPNAFSVSRKINSTKANQSCYDAVDYVLQHGSTLPHYVRYFRANYSFHWRGYETYCVIGNTYFGFFSDWESGRW